MCLLAAIVWVPAIRKPFPNQVQARIPLVICLFVFTINPLLGTAVQNCCCGILGTFWACFHVGYEWHIPWRHERGYVS